MNLFKIQDNVGERKSKYKLLMNEARLGSKRRFLIIRTVSSGIIFQKSNGLKTLVCFKMKFDNFIEKIRILPVIEGESVTDTKAHLLLHPYEKERRNHAWQFKEQLVATTWKTEEEWRLGEQNVGEEGLGQDGNEQN